MPGEKSSRRSPDHLVGTFESLLDKPHHKQHEQEIQEYLERNPALLPGLFDYHNGPAGDMVVAKLELGDFIPDFAFATQTTGSVQFTFVEIEDPCKRIFTRSDAFTQKFWQALQQTIEWVGSCDRSKERLQSMFGSVTTLFYPDGSPKSMRCKAYLIYGRRDEVNNRKRSERWAAHGLNLWGPGRSVEVMTYDRLMPTDSRAFEWVYTVNRHLRTCVYKDRKFVQKSPAP